MNIREQFENIEWNKADRIAPLVLLLLILALCWKLASMFWWVVAPPQVMQPEQVRLGSQQTPIPNISGFSLFYEESKASADESIPMQLQGVIVGYPARNSSAVIKVNEAADRIVVGQTLDGTSYQLAEVYWDHVVLRQNNGASRELKFTGMELNQPIVADGSSAKPASSSKTPASSPDSGDGALTQAIQKMNEDHEQYMKDLGVNKTNGADGYEITDKTPAALRSKLGLKSGDRILSLNGRPVGQGQNDAQLLEQAKQEGKVKIEIKRGDQVMTIQQSL
ncbi:type II secretion system protein N [Acinetobacter sp. WZC-1]|uniref:type II secretion system protein N n=1 Tax=Acinetobacter sp. WZC-1 TaxID=3459034 RepID=UPI00403D9AEB